VTRVAAALLQAGYFGPFGIDAFRYELGGRTKLQPRCEINARYTMGFAIEGLLHLKVLRSPHAHARIVSIDAEAARQMPGVLLVLTGADAVAAKIGALTSALMPEDFGAPKGHRTFQPLLVSDRVRHVGDRIAFVVAETLTQARDAADLVEVDYDPLPVVLAHGGVREEQRRGQEPGVRDDDDTALLFVEQLLERVDEAHPRALGMAAGGGRHQASARGLLDFLDGRLLSTAGLGAARLPR
jgi:hypothetical protein